MFRPALPLLCLLALGVAVAAQDPAQDRQHTGKPCIKCKAERTLPCTGKEHDQKRICGFTFPHKCNAIYQAACCNGLLKVLCPDCKDPVTEAELEDERRSRLQWLEAMQKLDQELGIVFAHVETDNFVYHFSIPGWKVKETTYNRTKAAHLWISRSEDVAKRFEAITGRLPGTKQTLWLSNTPSEAMKITLMKFGGGRSTPYRLNSSACHFSTWPNPSEGFTQDEEFHAHIAHMSAHLLTQAVYSFQLKLPAWFDEGMANWIEIQIFGHSRNTCFHEVQAKDPWFKADWGKKVFNEVASGKEASFATVSAMDLDKMKHRDLAYAWSYIDYMVKAQAEPFKKFVEAVKRSADTKRSVDEAYKVSMASFQELWKAWVLKNYGGR